MLVLVLGSIDVILGGIDLEISGAKERALLALLLVSNGRIVATETLIDELWAHNPPASAVSGLHVFVSRLRRQLGAWGAERLSTHASGYALRTEHDEVDAGRFLQALATGRTLLESGGAAGSAAALRAGMALWRGPAYDGISSLVVQAEAARLEEARVSCREVLIDAELAQGHHAQVLSDLDAAVNDHPYHERFWAQRMIALYRSGRQADALLSYQRLRSMTRSELGFEPTPELQRLELAILEHDPSLDWAGSPERVELPAVAAQAANPGPPPLPTSLRQAAAGPILGRDAEIRHLHEATQAEGPARCSVVLVSGESGVGKTRLVAEVARLAHTGGAHVLLGRCDEEPLVPYQPFAEALRAALEEAEKSGAEPDTIRQVKEFLGAGAATLAPGSEADRPGAFEAVISLLRELAQNNPVVLVIDDLHWADPPTTALLRYAVRRLEDLPVTVLCSYIQSDAHASGPMTALLEELRRHNLVTTTTLPGLAADQVQALASSALGRPVSLEFADSLQGETDGNPLFVLQLVRHLAETGGLDDDGNFADPDALRQVVPDSLMDVLTRRVTRLGPELDELLALAAVIGPEFDVELLAAVANRPSTGVAEALQKAVRAGLLVGVPDAPGRFTFAHALVRRARYRRLDAVERATLHSRVADVLEKQGWGSAAQLALHTFEAAATGSVDRAIVHGKRAADEAHRALAFEDGVDILERTLGLATAEARPRARLELLIALGDARWWAGDIQGSDAACTEALELARREDDRELFARAVLGRWRNNGAATQGYSASTPDPALQDILEEALAGLTEHPGLRAAILGRLSIASYWTAPIERRAELSDSAVALARAAGDDNVLLDALVDRQLALWAPGGEEERLTRSTEILELARRLGQRAREADARIFEALDHLGLGDVRAADEAIQRYVRASAQLRHPYYRWHLHFLPALRALMEGRFEEAERLTAAGAAEAEGAGTDSAFSLVGLQTLWLFYEHGRVAELAPFIDDAGEGFGEIAALDAARTWIAAEVGDLDKARELLDTFVAEEFSGVQRDIAWLAALWLLSGAAAVTQHREACVMLREMLTPYADRFALVWVGFNCGPVELALGRLAEALDDHAEATLRYDRAVGLAREAGMVPTELRARLDRCRLVLSRPEPATDLDTELAGIAERAVALGMAGVAERAEQLRSR